jgi:hypothetical protein
MNPKFENKVISDFWNVLLNRLKQT